MPEERVLFNLERLTNFAQANIIKMIQYSTICKYVLGKFFVLDLSLADSLGGIHASRSGLVWEWIRILDEMIEQLKMFLLEIVTG